MNIVPVHSRRASPAWHLARVVSPTLSATLTPDFTSLRSVLDSYSCPPTLTPYVSSLVSHPSRIAHFECPPSFVLICNFSRYQPYLLRFIPLRVPAIVYTIISEGSYSILALRSCNTPCVLLGIYRNDSTNNRMCPTFNYELHRTLDHSVP